MHSDSKQSIQLLRDRYQKGKGIKEQKVTLLYRVTHLLTVIFGNHNNNNSDKNNTNNNFIYWYIALISWAHGALQCIDNTTTPFQSS